MSKGSKTTISDDQRRRFEEAARELGCDESEERFDVALKSVAKHKSERRTPSKAAKRS